MSPFHLLSLSLSLSLSLAHTWYSSTTTTTTAVRILRVYSYRLLVVRGERWVLVCAHVSQSASRLGPVPPWSSFPARANHSPLPPPLPPPPFNWTAAPLNGTTTGVLQ
ncbi:hypothetical protein LZ31DRAFT_557586 [Colletotrichum somersetense]|nr:hypothetical protein LZ31DRAFT_557586 [Colletotrichum somersetense]